VGDKRRFDLFAAWIAERFPAPRIYDVAGGQGRLNEALTRLGREVTTFDRKPKRLAVRYEQRLFTVDEPCACDLVVGLHADGATRLIVEWAAKNGVPFAVVPCCSDNGTSYRVWMKHLLELARERGFARVEEHELAMDGRGRVIAGWPSGG
jgi:hypothetical protein